MRRPRECEVISVSDIGIVITGNKTAWVSFETKAWTTSVLTLTITPPFQLLILSANEVYEREVAENYSGDSRSFFRNQHHSQLQLIWRTFGFLCENCCAIRPFIQIQVPGWIEISICSWKMNWESDAYQMLRTQRNRHCVGGCLLKEDCHL